MIARRGILGLILAAPAAAKTVLEEAAGDSIAGNVGVASGSLECVTDADPDWGEHCGLADRLREAAGVDEWPDINHFDHMKSWSAAYRRYAVRQEQRRRQKIMRRIDRALHGSGSPVERGLALMKLAREFGV